MVPVDEEYEEQFIGRGHVVGALIVLALFAAFALATQVP